MVRVCVRSDNARAWASAWSRVHMHEPCYNWLVTFACLKGFLHVSVSSRAFLLAGLPCNKSEKTILPQTHSMTPFCCHISNGIIRITNLHTRPDLHTVAHTVPQVGLLISECMQLIHWTSYTALEESACLWLASLEPLVCTFSSRVGLSVFTFSRYLHLWLEQCSCSHHVIQVECYFRLKWISTVKNMEIYSELPIVLVSTTPRFDILFLGLTIWKLRKLASNIGAFGQHNHV